MNNMHIHVISSVEYFPVSNAKMRGDLRVHLLALLFLDTSHKVDPDHPSWSIQKAYQH